MDLLSDIIEKDNDDILENSISNETKFITNNTGFPELYKPKKISSWKQRLKEKNTKLGKDNGIPPKSRPNPKSVKKEDELTEAQSINQENLTRLNNMTDEQIIQEQRELLENLNPKLLNKLLNNINKRLFNDNETPLFPEIEGASGTWIGGLNPSLQNLPSLDDNQVNLALNDKIGSKDNELNKHITDDTAFKHVKFNDTVEIKGNETKDDEGKTVYEIKENIDDDDTAPLDYQMAQSVDHMTNENLLSDIHFMKRRLNEESPDDDDNIDIAKLDINDPNFDNKLHAKYFPDLPKDIDKLKWMQQIHNEDNDDESESLVIDDVSQIRFDFNGNLVPPNREITNTTRTALHHHSENPELAGYTIVELHRLSLSTFASQRCISIQILGRILYKLGKQSYYQLVPEIDYETYEKDGNVSNVMNNIYAMFWDLIKTEKIIESLQLASDEKFTKNLSVRTYAIDALWLWQKGGGDFRERQKKDFNNE